ncbi:hypothetical protein GYH30_048258 [Glycine max]|nr:hypothetical protein GYH30_048258 [Glycine max]
MHSAPSPKAFCLFSFFHTLKHFVCVLCNNQQTIVSPFIYFSFLAQHMLCHKPIFTTSEV